MKNFEKYKTAKERTESFWEYYQKSTSVYFAYETAVRFAKWLDMDTEEEKLLPCPFCGDYELNIQEDGDGFYKIHCANCGYISELQKGRRNAISAHNRVAKAVEYAKAAKNKEIE